MKLYRLMSFALWASSVAMCACSDSDNAEVALDNVLESRVEMSITLRNSAEAESVLPFEANMSWTASSDVEWITVTPSMGPAGGDYSVKAKIEANNTPTSRTGTVTVQRRNSDFVYGRYTITQPGQGEGMPEENANAPEGMKKNAEALVRQIGVGWCLGNTLESGSGGADGVSSETMWGNPKTTREMFAKLKEAGFNAVRIPARWYSHADADLNINSDWMARVKEIVDYAVSQDMYVILNSHHDNWYDRLPVDYNAQEINRKFENMWRQIATTFRDYDEHLILAAANEIVCQTKDGSENWGSPDDEKMAFTCSLMQLFVNTVRATGGNNACRCLMVQPWAANPRYGMDGRYVMPTDPVPYRLIFEYHCYDPYNYAIGKDVSGNQWAQHEVTEADYQDLRDLFAQINEHFVQSGIPCIMAEFGSTQDNHYTAGNDAADRIRAEYLEFVVREAKKYNIPGFFWDNGGFTGTGENFGLLDRRNLTFPDRAKTAVDAIMRGLR